MQQMILSGEKVITRAGYSTIMELVSLNKSALLIPTPGQTEQVYLSQYLSSEGFFSACSQKKVKPGLLIRQAGTIIPAEIRDQSNELLDNGLEELLEEHHYDRKSK
jgi:predicted glycosyltransferase